MTAGLRERSGQRAEGKSEGGVGSDSTVGSSCVRRLRNQMSKHSALPRRFSPACDHHHRHPSSHPVLSTYSCFAINAHAEISAPDVLSPCLARVIHATLVRALRTRPFQLERDAVCIARLPGIDFRQTLPKPKQSTVSGRFLLWRYRSGIALASAWYQRRETIFAMLIQSCLPSSIRTREDLFIYVSICMRVVVGRIERRLLSYRGCACMRPTVSDLPTLHGTLRFGILALSRSLARASAPAGTHSVRILPSSASM
ncbi:hypothetical protein GY45DRAFT_1326918 [Cubamyces sp. BRFM 1775]|nr:hypothetical protein GY45DRAFT_1326918 [Cubamyces sp. BRFM 1775]